MKYSYPCNIFLDAGKKECLQLPEQIDTEQGIPSLQCSEQIDTEQDGEGILSLQCAYLLN